jgi:DICT domain-containing protein
MLEGSILQKLETAHRGSKRPLNFGVYYKNTLVALCHALEDFILESEGTPLMITAFQRGKWYLQEAERYGDLAEKASQVVIMASPDTGFADHPTSQRSNVALVSLTPDDPVGQEWHLMILSETYAAMVLCQELSSRDYGHQGLPENDCERKFYGFWTFEPELVQETMEFAIAHIGGYNRDLQQALTQQVKQIVAAYGTKPRDDIGAVVGRVVEYLQHSQEDVSHLGESEELLTAPIHEQALNDNLVSNEMQAFLRMAQLIDQANAVNPLAAAEVAALSEAMGQFLDLPAWQLKRMRLAALLHGLGSSLVTSVHAGEEAPNCSIMSAIQALRAMPRMRAIAQIITHQSEWWNGSGIPAGLAYDAIPLESRILALVTHFQWHTRQLRTLQAGEEEAPSKREEILFKALAECQAKAGEAFDPKLVEALGLLVMGMQQGMSIEVNQPKIAAGMWLLDSDPTEEAQLGLTTS